LFSQSIAALSDRLRPPQDAANGPAHLSSWADRENKTP
jgi:hypothetical protein